MKSRFSVFGWMSAVFIIWITLQSLISLYPTYLWFDQLGFSSVFWITLSAQGLTGLAFGALFFLIAGINIFVARYLGKDRRKEKKSQKIDFQKMFRRLYGEITGQSEGGGNAGDEYVIELEPSGDDKSDRRINVLLGLGIFMFSIFAGFSAVTQWEVILKALNMVNFGVSDPIFGKDIGFYVFNLPFQKLLQGFIFSAFLISLLGVIFIYFVDGNIYFSDRKLQIGRGAKVHISAVLAIMTLLFAWRLWLGEFEILYSVRGVIFGAGYTDVKAQLLGYNLQILVLIVLAVLLVVNIFLNSYTLPVIGISVYVIVAIVMGGFYPTFVQNFIVKPNEITTESPYISNSIKFTRLAYGLDNVEEKEFPAKENLTLSDIKNNTKTIDNIRLWDTRPLIKSYRQLQGIRLYYDFLDVDVDRYNISGEYKQVMLSPRELKVSQLSEKAQTWVNQHLIFTHGYGLCMSPVSKQTPEGLPDLIVKDIPPVTKTNLNINRPEIYYGEGADNYAIVNTKEKEFDYPKGDNNVYASYKGKGGVELSNLLRKLAFTIYFSDFKILISEYITPQSRIMFDRAILKRVSKIAPFLSYDRDPYIVISDNGKLYWIQDAYTTTNFYPYSDPSGTGFNKFNYIRNSVKVVIDAYNGDCSFYVADGKDPIIKVYQKIYTKLFKPFSAMPEDIKKHIRYPYDMFMVQSQKYAAFHMSEPQVFYNQEDLWNIPSEVYLDKKQAIEGYYIIMKLPGEKNEEFILMLPYTPNKKDNMIAWLAGRCDMPNYGKLMVYKFPKEKLIYGPMQIEARIDQQTEISQQLTLWGQMGSRVIRGNILAIPIEQSILYVEPIYLEATNGELPELKRVIAAYGKNVAMAETLPEALSQVLGMAVSTGREIRKIPQAMEGRDLAKRALDVYNAAQAGLKQGNFGEFGQKWQELKNILEKLVK